MKNDQKVEENKNRVVKKNDFVELKFTGYANGEMFDSNIPENLDKMKIKGTPDKTIISVGHRMVVKGLDEFLEGKEIGKEYEVFVKAIDGFVERKREFVKTIPLKVFREQKINPYPGLALSLDGTLVKVIAVSGARVITDFNGPLAGKDLKYVVEIVRKVDDVKEKSKAILGSLFRFIPEFDVKEDRVVVKGPKGFDVYINAFKDKFKEIVGKELEFEEMEIKTDKKDETKAEEVKDYKSEDVKESEGKN